VLSGVRHRENDGLLIHVDTGDRITGAEQQIASLIDVLALLDPTSDTLDEHVIADQHRQCGISSKLGAKFCRGDLPPFERRSIADIGGRIRFVLLGAQLLEIAQSTDDLLLAGSRPLRCRVDLQRAMGKIYGCPR
jgi:hypothetical protein